MEVDAEAVGMEIASAEVGDAGIDLVRGGGVEVVLGEDVVLNEGVIVAHKGIVGLGQGCNPRGGAIAEGGREKKSVEADRDSNVELGGHGERMIAAPASPREGDDQEPTESRREDRLQDGRCTVAGGPSPPRAFSLSFPVSFSISVLIFGLSPTGGFS